MFLPSKNCVLVGFFSCGILTTVSALFVLSWLFSPFYPSPITIYSLSPTIILSFPSLVAITPNSKRCGLVSLNFPKNRVLFLFLFLYLILSMFLSMSLSRGWILARQGGTLFLCCDEQVKNLNVLTNWWSSWKFLLLWFQILLECNRQIIQKWGKKP